MNPVLESSSASLQRAIEQIVRDAVTAAVRETLPPLRVEDAKPVAPALDDLLDRRNLSCALALHAGRRVAVATLASLATRGGGPPFRLFGRRPLYRWGDAMEWAEQNTKPPRRSTSESDVQ